MNVIRNFVIQKVFVGVHYFYIYANKGQNETQVKLITVTYLIKLWLVTQAQ